MTSLFLQSREDLYEDQRTHGDPCAVSLSHTVLVHANMTIAVFPLLCELTL